MIINPLFGCVCSHHCLQKFLLQERDSYKEILDAYEKDPNIDVSAASSGRVKELDNIVDSYYKQVATLQAELEAVQNQLTETTVRSQMVSQIISKTSN